MLSGPQRRVAGHRAVGRAGEKGDARWASRAAGHAWEEEERAAEWTKAGKKNGKEEGRATGPVPGVGPNRKEGRFFQFKFFFLFSFQILSQNQIKFEYGFKYTSYKNRKFC